LSFLGLLKLGRTSTECQPLGVGFANMMSLGLLLSRSRIRCEKMRLAMLSSVCAFKAMRQMVALRPYVDTLMSLGGLKHEIGRAFCDVEWSRAGRWGPVWPVILRSQIGPIIMAVGEKSQWPLLSTISPRPLSNHASPHQYSLHEICSSAARHQ
jgi:hypothetical protein